MGRTKISTLCQRSGTGPHMGHNLPHMETSLQAAFWSNVVTNLIRTHLLKGCLKIWIAEFQIELSLGKQIHGSYGSDQLTYSSGEQPIKVMLGNYQHLGLSGSRIPQNLSLDCTFAMFYFPFRGSYNSAAQTSRSIPPPHAVAYNLQLLSSAHWPMASQSLKITIITARQCMAWIIANHGLVNQNPSRSRNIWALKGNHSKQ